MSTRPPRVVVVRACSARPQRHLSFLRRDDGAFAVFGLFVFVAMLLVAGLAIDMMRHETARIRMQGASDRAVLAASMLRGNGTTPQEIVEAWFTAEGLSAQLGGRIAVVENPETGRTVTVAPAASLPSTFSRLVGVNELSMATLAQAQESVAGAVKLEVVMVLDISGSMNGQGKIEGMRNAATSLTQMLLDGHEGDDDSVAITLVPYDTWVLPPSGFMNTFSNTGGTGACNDWTNWIQIENTLTQWTQRRNCNTDAWASILPYQNDPDLLTDRISALEARGSTSIDLGVRWGAAFFDPSLRPAITALVDAGQVPEVFRGRPYDWSEPGVVRALIVLTDGKNCCGSRGSQSTLDQNTINVCEGLHQRGVIVFTISFQAPVDGAALMQACASSDNHYFNADASQIMAAFMAIGTNIQNQALRLTL